MATTTIHRLPSSGSYIRRGKTTALNDGDTVDTGLVKVDGMIITSNSNDTVCSFTSQSAGVATIAGKTAGVAAVNVDIYWVAWQLPNST